MPVVEKHMLLFVIVTLLAGMSKTTPWLQKSKPLSVVLLALTVNTWVLGLYEQQPAGRLAELVGSLSVMLLGTPTG
jgi:hypothetical protein